MSNPAANFDPYQFSPAQRLDLISRLWDSLSDSEEELPIPEWHWEILNRRLDEADANPEAGIPWEQVRDGFLRGKS